MNLLVTNSQEVQAYTILRCMRTLADKVVITTGGNSVDVGDFRGLSFYSRFVDKQYTVPSFSDDWFAGRIQSKNTSAEEAYVRRIERICDMESIDVVFPSLDPEVYVFSKNKSRLASRGVLAVVPEYDVLRVPMDKALTIKAAQGAGFPCPETYFPSSVDDVDDIIQCSRPPWIVKPRLTAHGVHIQYAESPAKLKAVFSELRRFQDAPIIQRYIPGTSRRNFYITVDRNSELLSVLSPRVVRTYSHGVIVASKSVISSSTGPCLRELRTLVRNLGLWGCFTVQTKIDRDDGLPKLMEINARFGHHLWYRTELGVNEPMIYLQLARGERPSGNLEFPDGVMLLDPLHDLSFLCANLFDRMAGLGTYGAVEKNSSIEDEELSLVEILRKYKADYLNRRRKIMGPEIHNLLSDPFPCLNAIFHKFSGLSRNFLRRICAAFRRRFLKRVDA